jgi:hypothetical protein
MSEKRLIFSMNPQAGKKDIYIQTLLGEMHHFSSRLDQTNGKLMSQFQSV